MLDGVFKIGMQLTLISKACGKNSKIVIINLAKRCYCNAGACVYVCLYVCEYVKSTAKVRNISFGGL